MTKNKFSIGCAFLFAGLLVVLSNMCFSQNLIGGKEIKTGTRNNRKIEYVDREISVKIKPGIQASVAANSLSKFGAVILQNFDRLGWGLIEIPSNKNLFEVIEQIMSLPEFETAEPNCVDRAAIWPNDTYFLGLDSYPHQWSLLNLGSYPTGTYDADIDADEAWDITMGDSNTVLAILDSGIPLDYYTLQLCHPDLNDPNKIILGPDYINDLEGVRDKLGHGTHVAGIAAAETNNDTGIAGVAGKCKILVIQVFDQNGNATHSAFYNAVIYAVDYQVNHPGKRVVINFSGAGDSSALKEEAVNYADENNVLIVASAGNYHVTNNPDTLVRYPAKYSLTYPNVIAVAATDHNDTRSCYSGKGLALNVSAPGGYGSIDCNLFEIIPDIDDIFSTTPNYPFYYEINGVSQEYGYLLGTSMAAPHVTGTAGLILSLNNNLTPSDVRNILQLTADDRGASGFDTLYGDGRINAYKALKYTIEHYSTTIGGNNVNVIFYDNITTASGTTLTIKDGTTISFYEPNKTLTINGGLNIIGNVSIGGYGPTIIFNQNTTIPTGTTLNASNTTLVPGSGRTLTLNGGFSITGTVSIGGTGGTITFNQNVTTPAGSTLNILAGTTVNIGYTKSLTMNGAFNAYSSTIASTNRYRGSWERVNLYGGPNMIQNCTVKYGNYGIYINNSYTNTITGCTFDSCLNAGLYSISSNRNADALTVNNSSFLRMSTRGIGIINGRADLNGITSRLSQQGIMTYNGLVYLDGATINSNTSRGSYISGLTSTLYFYAADLLGGCNNFNNNGWYEVYITSNGGAKIGQYNNGILEGGHNNIINSGSVTGRLVYNAGRALVYAHKNYWGTSTTNGFYGQVDWSYPLSSPACPTGMMLADPGEPSGEINYTEYVINLKSLVEKNSDESVIALRQLAALAGPGGSYEKALGTTWMDFLNDIRKSKAASADLKSLATAYYVHSFLNWQDYQTVLDVTKEVLSNNPDDDLWLLCQSDRISALVNLNRTKEAQLLLDAINDRVEKIDPDLVGILQSIVGDEPRAKIAEKQSEEMPNAYMLEQNHPNPFNPFTEIRYQIPDVRYVTLKVYNVLGQEVATLVDGIQETGYKSIVFNAGDLPSGVYIYRLSASGSTRSTFTDVKRMIILK